MVEFSVVLLIKQKFDWDENAMKKDTKQFLSNGKRGEKDLRIGSKIQVIEDMEKEDKVDDTEMRGDFVMKNLILDNITILKNMPHYRKIDIMAFILFCGFYTCFNFIYFVICIHH